MLAQKACADPVNFVRRGSGSKVLMFFSCSKFVLIDSRQLNLQSGPP